MEKVLALVSIGMFTSAILFGSQPPPLSPAKHKNGVTYDPASLLKELETREQQIKLLLQTQANLNLRVLELQDRLTEEIKRSQSYLNAKCFDITTTVALSVPLTCVIVWAIISVFYHCELINK